MRAAVPMTDCGTGSGGDSGAPASRRGKNAPSAADRWPTFIFPASGDAVAVWGAYGTFLLSSMIAPLEGRAVVTAAARTIGLERKPISGVQRRRRPDRQASVATGVESWQSDLGVGSWHFGS
jgi:hypothetical protein